MINLINLYKKPHIKITFVLFILIGWLANAHADQLSLTLAKTTIPIDLSFTGYNLKINGQIASSYSNPQLLIEVIGPRNNIILQKKEKDILIWRNATKVTYYDVPLYYLLASSDKLANITSKVFYKSAKIGIDNWLINNKNNYGEQSQKSFIQTMSSEQLYKKEIGAIKIDKKNNFSLTINLPSNIAIGTYQIKAYLFHNQQMLNQQQATFIVKRTKFVQFIHKFAYLHSFLYGLLAIILGISLSLILKNLFRK